jgi:hypothetical protein
MRKTSLIATALTLTLTGAPMASASTASHFLDPIAHAASPVVDVPSGSYVDPFGHHHKHYVDPLGSGSTGTTPAPGHAYGKACANESHRHVAGTPGTPFSECVHALKVLSGGRAHNATEACRLESHRHVKGVKGTAFTRCVADAHRLMHAKRTGGADAVR